MDILGGLGSDVSSWGMNDFHDWEFELEYSIAIVFGKGISRESVPLIIRRI
jgi:hypothetical protein